MSASETKGFKAGLFSKNPWLLAGAVALVLGLLVYVDSIVGVDWVRRIPEGEMLADPMDDYTHIIYKIIRLRSTPPAHPLVFIFGSSGSREGFEDEISLSRELNDRGAGPASAVLLDSSAQSLVESNLLLEALPKLPPGGVIVLTLSALQMVTSPHYAMFIAGQRWGRLPYADKTGSLLSSMGYRQAPWTRYLRMGWTRALCNGWGRRWARLEYQRHHNDQIARLSDSEIEENLRKVGASFDTRSNPYLHANIELIQYFVSEARRRGQRIIFVELPTAPKYDQLLEKRHRVEIHAIEQLAQESGIPYWNPRPAETFRDGDFHDLTHLLEPGRGRFQRWFVRMLAASRGAKG